MRNLSLSSSPKIHTSYPADEPSTAIPAFAHSSLVPLPSPSETPLALEEPFDITKAARVLGIRIKTLRDWVRLKKIEYFKSGKRVMFRQQVLRDFIRHNTVPAA